MALRSLTFRESWAQSAALYPNDSLLRHLFRYLSIREGVVLEVYPDSHDTITGGVGHQIPKSLGYKVGQQIDLKTVLAWFKDDIIKHKFYDIKADFKGEVGAVIGAQSFLWTHGVGAYTSHTYQNLMKKRKSEKEVQEWVALNWDRSNAVARERNRMDVSLMYAREKDGVKYYHSSGGSGTFVYVPSIDESFYSFNEAMEAAKKKLHLTQEK